MPLDIHFPASLKRMRLARGLSQEKLSGLADLDRTYISMLERGIRKPSLTTIEKIAQAMDMPAWEFIKDI